MEALKSLCLPNKTSVSGTTALKVKNATNFETISTLYIFKSCYSNLAENFLIKFPIPPEIYTFNSAVQYYRHFVQTDTFHLTYTTEIDIEKIYEVQIFISCELWNLSIKLESFANSCKIAKLKLLFKKGSKTNPSTYRSKVIEKISKVIEKIIHEQKSSVLSNNETLYNYHSGFRKNTRQNYVSHFCIIKFWRVFIRAWWYVIVNHHSNCRFQQFFLIITSRY